jgi:OmpA-OmpF porin, OOP family
MIREDAVTLLEITRKITLRLGLLGLLSVAATVVVAQAQPKRGSDVAGVQDHPLIKRFNDSWLIGVRNADWDQAQFPLSAKVQNEKLVNAQTVEGKLTRLYYLAPVGKTPLEVFRNYEQALLAAGLVKKFACESNCADLSWPYKPGGESGGVTWAKGDLYSADGSSRWSLYSAHSYEDARVLYGTITKGGSDIHVMVYTSVAGYKQTNAAYTLLQIVEPKAMQTGQVVVDTKAMQSSLQADGKIALYGIYFDTGKAVVKPESKAQLDEMAKLLQSQPALKVFVVGHTDNQGGFDSNMGLSQQRAQAVVNALISGYKLDAQRLQARGVANLTPVATNANDQGRARNRRVELVVQ